MKKFMLLIVSFCLLNACATLESLNKVEPTSYFVLEEHHIRQEMRGMISTLWVEALLKGKYVEYAQDDHGTFYLGQQPSVVVLAADNAQKFVDSKEISPGPFLYGSLTGGLWIPKEGSDKSPKLFFTMKQANNGSVAGAIGMTVTNLLEGSLDYVPYESETEFVKNIKIQKI